MKNRGHPSALYTYCISTLLAPCRLYVNVLVHNRDCESFWFHALKPVHVNAADVVTKIVRITHGFHLRHLARECKRRFMAGDKHTPLVGVGGCSNCGFR